MALPVTISATEFPDQNYFMGPFIDGNGNVYVIIPDSGPDSLEAWKATDPTDSFAEQDSGGKPVTTITRTAWVFQDGDTLHCVVRDAQSGDYEYSIFYTSDHATLADTWDNTVVNEQIEDLGVNDPIAGEESVSIVQRSDGSTVVIYQGTEDKVKGCPFARVDYNIRSGGT